MLYRLSKIIPVPMKSTYGVEDVGVQRIQRATWWQWRGHIFRHRNTFVRAA
jgi:hypothetical protein